VLAVGELLGTIRLLSWGEAASVDVTVAISAERDQIFVCIVTEPAS